jgi:hypothetical protein
MKPTAIIQTVLTLISCPRRMRWSVMMLAGMLLFASQTSAQPSLNQPALGLPVHRSTEITSPTNGTTFTAPANIIITAKAIERIGIITNVQFYQGTTLIGADSTSPYSISWNNVQPGTYKLTTVAMSKFGELTPSAPVTVFVLPPPCTPAPTGLVGWWQAEGNTLDALGINNGTAQGALSFATGEVGQSFVLDGFTTSIRVPASSSLDVGVGDGLTTEAWINPQDYSFQSICEWNRNNGAGTGAFSGGQIGAHLELNEYNADGSLWGNLVDTSGNSHVINTGGGIILPNTWQHVAMTYDKTSGAAVLYCNGTAVATANLGTFTSQTSSEFFMGRRPAGPFAGLYFNGQMDEVSVYNRALSAAEIQTIYNAGSAGKCPVPLPPCTPAPSGLVGWWPGESNANDIVGDHNGTLLGPVSFSAGEVGQSFVLNGSNTGIQVPASSSLDVGLDEGLTTEAWINPQDYSFQSICEWNKNNGAGTGAFSGGEIGAHLELNEYNADGSLWGNLVDTSGNAHGINTGGGIIVSNTWQHVAMTYDKASGATVLYCNGTAVATANLGTFTPQTSSDLFMGQRPAGPFAGLYFRGQIDEVSVYNRALSAAEIQAIYHAGNAGKCSP